MNYFKNLILASLFVLVTSCTYSDMIRGEVAERGAEAEDQVLESAEWVRCNKASIGAVRREYDTPEKFAEYLASCPQPE
jgi:hypothetical protein